MRQRVVQPEWMDDPSLDAAEHARALRGLGRINRLSGSAETFWPALLREHERPRSTDKNHAATAPALRIVDFACGGGDVLIRLARRANRLGMKMEWTGLDISDTALSHARESATRSGVDVQFVKHDVCAQVESPNAAHRYDAAISSLFLHHLDAPTATRVLAAMRIAAPCVLVNDLRRGPVAYRVAWVGTRVLSRSPVVRLDGPQSVAAGWTLREMRELADAAGLRGATVQRRFPWRLLLDWREGTT